MILLLPPVHRSPQLVITEFMQRNGYTVVEEIEPKAGCRRFRFS